MTYTKTADASLPTNYMSHVKDLNERFGRMIKQLGPNNRRGSPRYEFEVNFAYALNEIANCPFYLQGKMFDLASAMVNSLMSQVKQSRDDKSEAA